MASPPTDSAISYPFRRAQETHRCRRTHINNHRKPINTKSQTIIYNQKNFGIRKKKEIKMLRQSTMYKREKEREKSPPNIIEFILFGPSRAGHRTLC